MDMDLWMGVVAVLTGLATCFYGYPLFRFLLILAGLIVGYAFGQIFFEASHPWLSVVIGIAAAALLAAFAYPLWSVGVTLSGAALGFLFVGSVCAALNLSQGVTLVLGAIGAVITATLFYQARDLFVMLTTAFNGALEVAYGLGWLFPALSLPRRASQLLSLLIIFALGAIGFAAQYSMFKDRRTYSQISTTKPA
jgi:hypothetical protein